MQETWTLDLVWWITVVELPALAGLFWFGLRSRRDSDDALDGCRERCSSDVAQVREALAAYKLEVAKSYASIPYLKEVERRLTAHLVRIEDKLDRKGPDGAGARR